MSKEKQIDDKNCNGCLHFEACCKWTDFPRQIGFPVCGKYAPITGYRKQSEGEWIAKNPMIRSPFARNYYCSVCKYEPIETKSYCPECGAKMKGGEHG